MLSLDRRLAARRQAWGRGPNVLSFVPAALPTALPTPVVDTSSAANPTAPVAPTLVVRFPGDWDAVAVEEVAVAPAAVSLGLVRMDGSRTGIALPAETNAVEAASPDAQASVPVSRSRRLSTRLLGQQSHLRVYQGDWGAAAANLGLLQA